MNRLFVAIANLHQVRRKFAGFFTLLDVLGKMSAVALDGARIFIERHKQPQGFSDLLVAELFLVGQFQADIFRAQLDEDSVQLIVVRNILHAFFSGNLVERRLGDVHVAVLH